MANDIQMIRLRPNRKYESFVVRRSPDIPQLLVTKDKAWLDDVRHASICSQYSHPFYDDPDEIDPELIEPTSPSIRVWKPKEIVFTLDGQSEILSTDTSLRDAEMNERLLQDTQRSRLLSAGSQHAIEQMEKKDAKDKRNDFILTALTLVLLLAVVILAMFFMPDILDQAGELTSSFTVPGL